MSNIYIQEPPTSGKVLLVTTAGDIDIELWSKEAPLACRNFIQLCMEGYYDNVIFHRVVKGFIVQTGDPSGTGFGGESIYGSSFKDEFHSRLRFIRRGLVALANGGTQDDNGSQFFFTLDAAPDLQNKHTIFGKVTGQTLYNMLRIGEGEVDQNERPLYPHTIISTKILNNPFDDIVPRVKSAKKVHQSKEEKARNNVKANKNFALLSFGDEAEEEEEEISRVSNEYRGKSKSSHDLLKDDSKLSSIPAIEPNELEIEIQQSGQIKRHKEDDDKQQDENKTQRLNKIKEKFNDAKNIQDKKQMEEEQEDIEDFSFFANEKQQKKAKKIEKAEADFNQLKKTMQKDKLKKTQETIVPKKEDPILAEFVKETKEFKEKQRKIPKKGEGREEMCWNLMKKFKSQLQNSKNLLESKSNDDDDENKSHQSTSSTKKSSSWLMHQMHSEGNDEIVLARDANIRAEEDWFDIYDPRNPMNKRKRNER